MRKFGTVVTGVTGFVGSHLAVQLLRERPDDYLVCIARPKGDITAAARVMQALRAAHENADADWALNEHLDRVLVAEQAHCENLLAQLSTASEAPSLSIRGFWHCAASVKFSGSYGSDVWRSNVDELDAVLQTASRCGAPVFNHVSTAYVAGAQSGRIPEATDAAPQAFNNIYEESKHTGEQLVRAHCAQRGMAYRILRPSIIIGHSRTFKTTSGAGFYQFLDALRGLRNKVEAVDPLYFRNNPLRLRCDRNATLDLIPIDIVVAELIDIDRHGERTANNVFHITSESPVSLHDLVHRVTAVLGIGSVEIVGPEVQLRLIDRLLDKQVRAFTPYISQRKVFDRRNAAKHGIDRHQMRYLLDVGRMEAFARHYLAQSMGVSEGDEWSGERASAPEMDVAVATAASGAGAAA
jgi:nucleoside-diphosphate-sugar epimerase